MRPMLTALAASLLPLATAAAQEAAGPRAFAPGDWYRVTTLSAPALSPDGRLVAFTVATVKEKDNRRHREVWIAPVDGGEPYRVTAPGTESSNPRWSPDGAYLFFTSNRPGGKGSTWSLRMDRPAGEAVQLENYPSGSVPRDGRLAVWTAPAEEGGEEGREAGKGPWAKMPPMARPPDGAITRPLDPSRFDGRHIVELGYKRNGRGFVPNRAEPREWRPAQLWVQAFGDTAKRQITDTPYSHRNAVVSPDGRRIAFVADAQLRPDSVVQAERDSLALLPYDAARDEAPRNDMDIYVIGIDGGEPRKVVDRIGSEGRLAWSPDGRRIAFISNDGVRTGQRELYVVDAAGGEPRELLGDWPYEPGSVDWLPGGDLIMTASVGGRDAVFRVGRNGGEPRELIGGRRRLYGVSYDRDFRSIAFVASSMDRPTELYIADIDGGNERRLTGLNDEINAEIAWADAERFTYESVGGREIEAWLMKPYGYEPGRTYPLVLYIHGGPHSRYGENWFDEFQNIAGAGMWVLFTNPRGSGGYGADFTYVTRGEWGGDDFLDLMKAVDIAAARPDVDSTRMGVTGGSYGGFMTAWVTTKTDRFKAAEADRMISDWWSWYGTSDVPGLTEFEFYGKPWDNPAPYDTLSPIRYARNVKTPTLIVQSEEDHRTPMTDAEQWFVALKKHDVPVELVRYPRSTHDLSRTGEPWLLVDRLARLRQWFAYWLKGEEPATVAEGSAP